jgi:hypothetical protein
VGSHEKVTVVLKNKDTAEPLEHQAATAAAESMNQQVVAGSPPCWLTSLLPTLLSKKKQSFATDSNKISTAATNVDPTTNVSSAELEQPVVVVDNEPDESTE